MRARAGEVNTAYKLYRVWSTRNVSFGKISRKYAIPETFTRLLISRYENCTRIIRITTRDALPTLWTDLIIDRSFRYSFPLSLSPLIFMKIIFSTANPLS